jgi:hypothetical protein
MMTPAMVHYGLAPVTAKTGNWFSMPPIRLIPNGSFAARLPRCHFPRRSGLTGPKTQTTNLTKLHFGVSQSR